MIKKYQVIFQDEYNNLFLVGFYDELEDAIPDINNFLEVYGKKIDSISCYPSTFGEAFDTDIEIDEGCVSVRGFVLEGESYEQICSHR